MTVAVTTAAKGALQYSSQIRWAAGGWAFFIAENAILSENRTYIIEQIGNEQYHGLYGLFSTAATSSIVYAYYKLAKQQPIGGVGAVIARPTSLALFGSWSLISLGLIMASQALPKLQIPVTLNTPKTVKEESSISGTSQALSSTSTPDQPPARTSSSWQFQVRCPFDFNHNASSSGTAADHTVRGLDRVSRHSGLWSLGCVGLGQSLLVAPQSLPLKVWWMGPAAVAWLGGMHHDSRMRRGIGGTLDPWYDAQTSNIPFVALLTGRQGAIGDQLKTLVFGNEIKHLNAGLAMAGATMWVLSRGRVRV